MDWFSKVMKYYTENKYNEGHVRVFVEAGHITKEDYELITGKKF